MGPPSSSNEEKIYGYIDLFKQVGDARPTQVYSLCTREVKIGREHRCDIRIHNLRISRLQCCVNVTGPEDNQKVRLQNLTAKATTYFNNRNVQPDEQVELKDGDRFRLYDTELRFRNFKPSDPHLETVTGKQIPIIRLVPKDKHGGAQTPPSNKVSSGLRSPKTEKIKSPHTSSRSADRMNKSMPGNSRVELDRTPKRRKSSDVDMRKAVLQRRFRKSVQGRIFPEEIPERQEAGEEEDEDEDEDEQEELNGVQDSINETVDTEATFVDDSASDLGSRERTEKVPYIIPEDESVDLLSPVVVEKPVNEEKQNNSEDLIQFEDIEREMFALHEGSDKAAASISESNLEDGKFNGSTSEAVNNEKTSTLNLPEGIDSEKSKCNGEEDTSSIPGVECNLPEIGYDSFSSRWDDSFTTGGRSFHTAVSEDDDDERNLSFEPMEVDEIPCTQTDMVGDSSFYDSCANLDATADIFQSSIVGNDEHAVEPNADGPQTVTHSVCSVEIDAAEDEGGEDVNDDRENSKAQTEQDLASEATTLTQDSQDAGVGSQDDETTEAIELELASLFHSEVEAAPATTVSALSDEKDSEAALPDDEQELIVNSSSGIGNKPQDESCEQEELESSKFDSSSPVVDLQDDSNDNEGPLPDVVAASIDYEVLQIVEVVDAGESVNDAGKDKKEEQNLERENADDFEGSVVSASDNESVDDVPAHVSSVEIMEMETQVIIIEENAANIDGDEELVETQDKTLEESKRSMRESASRSRRETPRETRSMANASTVLDSETLQIPESSKESIRETPSTPVTKTQEIPNKSPGKQSAATPITEQGEGHIESPVLSRNPEIEISPSAAASASKSRYPSPNNTGKIPVKRGETSVAQRRSSRKSVSTVEVEDDDSKNEPPANDAEACNNDNSPRRSVHGEPKPSLQKTLEVEIDLTDSNDEGFMMRNALTTPRRSSRKQRNNVEIITGRNAMSTPRTRSTRATSKSELPASTPSRKPTRSSESSDVEVIELDSVGPKSAPVPQQATSPQPESESLSGSGSETEKAPIKSAEISFPSADSDIEADLESVADFAIRRSAQNVPEEQELRREVIPEEEEENLAEEEDEEKEEHSEEEEKEEAELPEEEEKEEVDLADKEEKEKVDLADEEEKEEEDLIEEGDETQPSMEVSQGKDSLHMSLSSQSSVLETATVKQDILLKECSVVLKRLVMDFDETSSEEDEYEETENAAEENDVVSEPELEEAEPSETAVDKAEPAQERSPSPKISSSISKVISPVAVSITPQKTDSTRTEKTPTSSEKRETLLDGETALDSPVNANRSSSTRIVVPKPSTSSSPERQGNSPPPVQFKTLYGVRYDASIKLCNLNIVVTRLEDDANRERRNTRQKSSAKESRSPRTEDIEYVDLEHDEESESSSTPDEAPSSSNKSRRTSRRSLQEIARSPEKVTSDGDSDILDASTRTALLDTNQQSTSPVSHPRKSHPKKSGNSPESEPISAPVEDAARNAGDISDEIIQEDMKTAEDEVSDAETIPIIRSKPVRTPKSASRRRSAKLDDVLELDSDEEEIKSSSDVPSQSAKTRKARGRGKKETIEEAITQKQNDQQIKAISEKESQSSDADEEEGGTQSKPAVEDHDGITRKAKSNARSKRGKLPEDEGPTEMPETKVSDIEMAAPESNIQRKGRRAPKTKETALVVPSPHGRRTRAQEVEIIQQVEPAKPNEDEETESNGQETNNLAVPSRRGRRLNKENAAGGRKKQTNKSPNKGSNEGSANDEVLTKEKVDTAGSKARSKRVAEVSESAGEPEPAVENFDKAATAKTGRRKVKAGKTDAQESDHEQPQEEPTERPKSRRGRAKKDSDESSQERIANVTSSSSDSAGRPRRQKPVPVVTLEDDEEPVRKKAKKGKESDQQEQKKSQKSGAAQGKSNMKPVVELTRIDIPAQSPRLTRRQSTDSEQVVPGPSSLPPPPKKKAKGRKKVDGGSSSKDEEPPSDTESVSSRTRGRKGKEPESDAESVSGRTRGRKVNVSDKKTKIATQSTEVRSQKTTENHDKKEAPVSSSRTTRHKTREEEVIELESDEEEKPKTVEKPKRIRKKVEPTELSDSEAENEKPKTRSERRGNIGVVKKPAAKGDDGEDEHNEPKTKRRRKPEVKEAPKTRKGRAKAVSKSDSEEVVVEAEVRTRDDSPDIEHSEDEVVIQKPSTNVKATKSSKRLKRTEDEEVVVESESRKNRRRPAVPSESAESDKKIEKRPKTRQVKARSPKVVLQLPETNNDVVELDVSSDEEERPKPKAKRARTEKEPAKSPATTTRTTRRRVRN